MLHWGATYEELRKPLPGDDLVPDPAMQSTRAVTIEAPPEAVWPWLAQLGQDRAGFYSYEWLENLAGCEMHNADEIHPEWQDASRATRSTCTRSTGCRSRASSPAGCSPWRAGAPSCSSRTAPATARLIARGRTPRGIGALANTLLMEIPHFVMERKMLLGIKERAERTHTAALRRAMQSAPVEAAVHA